MNDAITQSPAFTPEAVRSVLLAAGFSEHKPGEAEGFAICDRRGSQGEILVEVCGYHGTGEAGSWTGGGEEHMPGLLWGYMQKLWTAGYLAGMDDRMVTVFGTDSDEDDEAAEATARAWLFGE